MKEQSKAHDKKIQVPMRQQEPHRPPHLIGMCMQRNRAQPLNGLRMECISARAMNRCCTQVGCSRQTDSPESYERDEREDEQHDEVRTRKVRRILCS